MKTTLIILIRTRENAVLNEWPSYNLKLFTSFIVKVFFLQEVCI